MSYGSLLNQSIPTSADEGLGALTASYPIASGQTISAGDVVDVVSGQIQKTEADTLGKHSPGDEIVLASNSAGSTRTCLLLTHDYESDLNGTGYTLLAAPYILGNNCEFEGSSGYTTNYPTSTIRSRVIASINNDYFSDRVKAAILTTKYEVVRVTTSGSKKGTSVITDSAKGFVLSATEVGLYIPNFIRVGTKLPSEAITALASFMYEFDGSRYWSRTVYVDKSTTYEGNDRASVFFDQSYGQEISGAEEYTHSDNEYFPVFCLPQSFILDENNLSGNASTQAIALESGTAGQTISIIYDGNIDVSWATANQTITSTGVKGFCPVNGKLSVTGYWVNS